MRRKEREITDFEEIIKILDESNFLTLAMIKGTEPYSVPVNFGYRNASILEDADEKKGGLICILKKYGYKGPSVFPAIMMKKISMIRIDVDDLTGKFHEK